jgi:hypothetical protein
MFVTFFMSALFRLKRAFHVVSDFFVAFGALSRDLRARYPHLADE